MSVLDLLRRSHPNVDSPTYRRLAGVHPEPERSDTRPVPATSCDCGGLLYLFHGHMLNCPSHRWPEDDDGLAS